MRHTVSSGSCVRVNDAFRFGRQAATSVHTLSDIRNKRRRRINLRLDQMIRLLHRLNGRPGGRGRLAR
ncbi:hypothetical protein GCM10010214_02250 [Streptomyces abikoensis]|nr:hypothetical protein GCM10010214_02250 [Streptomyces abikoensis]